LEETPVSPKKAAPPRVGIVLGSESDLETMRPCATTLAEFGIPYELRVISAHRTPDTAHEYATSAAGRGLAVIIAAAGGAAHLAGVLASVTALPVIGVPMPTTGLGGLDSLLSTVQMPGGVPVATVAVGIAGGKNAGLLAVQILALGDNRLSKALADHKVKMQIEVLAKDISLPR
jgi:5-(carboxyamino)imidazole ribonucleotide mutase